MVCSGAAGGGGGGGGGARFKNREPTSAMTITPAQPASPTPSSAFADIPRFFATRLRYRGARRGRNKAPTATALDYIDDRARGAF
jgi:hypothetical protein